MKIKKLTLSFAVGVGLISTIILGGCNLFKKQNNTQASITKPHKTLNQISWNDIYTYTLNFLTKDLKKQIKFLENTNSYLEKNNLTGNIQVNGNNFSGGGSLNILSSGFYNINPTSSFLYKIIANLNLNIPNKIGKFNLSGDLYLGQTGKNLYIKLNDLQLESSNLFINMYIGTIKSLEGQWIKISLMNQKQINLKDAFKIIDTILENLQKYPVYTEESQEIKNQTKIFKIKLNKNNLEKVVLNTLNSPEAERLLNKKLSEKDINNIKNFINGLKINTAIVKFKSFDDFEVDFGTINDKKDNATVNIKLIGSKNKIYFKITATDIKNQENSLNVELGKSNKYFINLNEKGKDFNLNLSIKTKLETSDKKAANNTDIIGNISTSSFKINGNINSYQIIQKTNKTKIFNAPQDAKDINEVLGSSMKIGF